MAAAISRWVVIGAALLPSLASASTATPAAFGFREADDGATCAYFDAALHIAWPGGGPAGIDVEGRLGGRRGFATLTIDARQKDRVTRAEIGSLVRAWARGELPGDGLLLAPLAGKGVVEVHAREDRDIALRPTLRVQHADGGVEYLDAAADAAFHCSTNTGLGTQPRLRLGPDRPAALRFDLGRLRKGKATELKSAELVLVRAPGAGTGQVTLAVLRLATPWSQSLPAPPRGLAAAYPRDAGIAGHPAVFHADGFGDDISPAWQGNLKLPMQAVQKDDALLFWPLVGPALRTTIAKGTQTGLDLRYPFKLRHGGEPDEVYLRYYLRFSAAWLAAVDGGKMPGFGGTYGVAAWGGRPWDGALGWSARGAFAKPAAKDHPAHGRIALGSYVYHQRGDPKWGEVMTWGGGDGAALIEPDRWVCVEQHIRLNTPGRSDGVLRAWIDGRAVFERRDLRLRDKPGLHVENVWMNIYHGGTAAAPADLHLYIDQVVIAREYIGPMAP